MFGGQNTKAVPTVGNVANTPPFKKFVVRLVVEFVAVLSIGLKMSEVVLAFEMKKMLPFGARTAEPYLKVPARLAPPVGTIVENSLVLGLKTPMLVAEAGVKYTRPSGPSTLEE
jgi:hypothetical protein